MLDGEKDFGGNIEESVYKLEELEISFKLRINGVLGQFVLDL